MVNNRESNACSGEPLVFFSSLYPNKKRLLVNQKCILVISDHVSGMETKVSVGNLATIAVLASSKDVPLTSFTLELQHSLIAIGKCHPNNYNIK